MVHPHRLVDRIYLQPNQGIHEIPTYFTNCHVAVTFPDVHQMAVRVNPRLTTTFAPAHTHE